MIVDGIQVSIKTPYIAEVHLKCRKESCCGCVTKSAVTSHGRVEKNRDRKGLRGSSGSAGDNMSTSGIRQFRRQRVVCHWHGVRKGP